MDTYYVWRRSDGYIGATNGQKPNGHSHYTFEHLLATPNWQEAAKLIAKERKKNPSFWLHK